MLKLVRRSANVLRLGPIAILLMGLAFVSTASAALPALSFARAEREVSGLAAPFSLALSPDGEHVYVACTESNAVLVFQRDRATGALTFVEKEQDGTGSVDGLGGASAVAVSPDGNHVYVVGYVDNAVVAFSRNATTGALTFVEMKRNGDGSVGGLDGPLGVAVSPDGKHVYATGKWTGAVVVFSRNVATGALTFVEVKMDGDGGIVDGLYGARSVAVSPDGGSVYVIGTLDKAIAVFRRDATTGALTFVEVKKDGAGGVDGLDGAFSVAVSPDWKHVYVTGIDDNAVAVFSRNVTTSALTFVEVKKDGAGSVDGLYGARSVAVSPDGGHVYVTGASDDAVAAFHRNATTGALTFVGVQKDGVGGVDGLWNASAVVVSPDGGHVYVAGYNDNAIAVFGRNVTAGTLTFVTAQRNVDGLSSARSVAVSPDGRHVYVAGYKDNAVAAFSQSAVAGVLAFVEMKQDGLDSVNGLYGAISVAVSPDGKHVYVAGYLDNAVAAFSRNATTGALAFVERKQDGVDSVDGLYGTRSVAVSPDGKHVYVAGYYDKAVAVFSRNATTGALTFVEVHWDTDPGKDGLNGASSIAVSPDGRHLYVAGAEACAVAVFSRNGTTGALTFVETKKDGVDGVDGLGGAISVAVSPDGRHVYVAGLYDDAVAAFSRNATTGRLTFVETKKDGVGGVEGLGGPRAVDVSPDGHYVYAAGYNDDAVAVFSRNATTGALAFAEMHQDGVSGVDGLDGPYSVAVSPGGSRVYVAGSLDSALAVFIHESVVYLPAVVRNY